MPDRRKHRGPHPEDDRLFASAVWPALRAAVADLRWLLGRGYTGKSALKLVGDRYNLVVRQRTAVARCTCSEAESTHRESRRVEPDALVGRSLAIDGYNVLTTIEAALAGAVIVPGCDGTYRDMASMHGSYRKVAETVPALELLGRVLAEHQVGQTLWYLDRPVSNSGRLKTVMAEVAARHGWSWQIELAADPDALLAETEQVIVTADSAVLDRCTAWFNLARATIDRHLPKARILEMVDRR